MVNNRSKNDTYDALAVLHNNAAAITATAFGTNASAAAITRVLGATAAMGSDQSQGADMQFRTLVDILAIDAANADEVYTFNIYGTDDGFSTSKLLGSIDVPRASVVGSRLEVLSSLWQNNTIYDEVRCEMALAGTTPSIIYHARMVRIMGSEK